MRRSLKFLRHLPSHLPLRSTCSTCPACPVLRIAQSIPRDNRRRPLSVPWRCFKHLFLMHAHAMPYTAMLSFLFNVVLFDMSCTCSLRGLYRYQQLYRQLQSDDPHHRRIPFAARGRRRLRPLFSAQLVAPAVRHRTLGQIGRRGPLRVLLRLARPAVASCIRRTPIQIWFS